MLSLPLRCHCLYFTLQPQLRRLRLAAALGFQRIGLRDHLVAAFDGLFRRVVHLAQPVVQRQQFGAGLADDLLHLGREIVVREGLFHSRLQQGAVGRHFRFHLPTFRPPAFERNLADALVLLGFVRVHLVVAFPLDVLARDSRAANIHKQIACQHEKAPESKLFRGLIAHQPIND